MLSNQFKRRCLTKGRWLLLVAVLAVPALALAQTRRPPDAGLILQETRPVDRVPTVTLPPIDLPALPRPDVPAVSSDVRTQVSHFWFSGNSALSQEILSEAVAPWAGRSLNFGELIQAVEAVEARYKEAGFFLAQASLPPQKIHDGAIEIAISEGRLGETRLEGESRIAPDVLYGYLDRLPKGEALMLPTLERQILLINELSGSRASLDLQAGDKAGTTDVVLTQQLGDLLSGQIQANNHGSASTGERLYGITLNTSSPFSLGERISANAQTSENGGLISYNLRGELPVGGDGWRLMASASRAEYFLGGAFTSLDASGTADSLRVGAGYPIIRSRNANLRIQAEVDHNKLVDKYQSTNTELDKQVRGLTVTLSGDMQDAFMGGGTSRADFALRSGILSLGNTAAQNDAPPTGPEAAGHFNKANITALRLQTITQNISLQAQLTWQLANKNLDSSEKFFMGGPTTLPGYAIGEFGGDSGFLGKLSLRWQAMPAVSLTAFADYAHLRLAHKPLPTVTRNTKQLSDTGVVIDWAIDKNLSANAILAWAGNEASSPTDYFKPRVWFNLGYGF